MMRFVVSVLIVVACGAAALVMGQPVEVTGGGASKGWEIIEREHRYNLGNRVPAYQTLFGAEFGNKLAEQRKRDEDALKSFEQSISQLGKEGWELVTVTLEEDRRVTTDMNPSPNYVRRYYFKRVLP